MTTQQCVEILIGRGTKVTIWPLEDGVCAEPVAASLSVSALAAKGTFSISLSAALPAGIVIPSGAYFSAIAPSGKSVLLQASGRTASGSSIAVNSIPIDVAIGSTIDIPVPLSGRTEANFNRNTNTVKLITFDTGSAESSRSVSTSAQLVSPGVYSQLDPAYKNCEFAREKGTLVYCWVQLLPPSIDYAVGTIYKFEAVVGSLPVGIPAAGTIKGDITLEVTGIVTTVDPQPT